MTSWPATKPPLRSADAGSGCRRTRTACRRSSLYSQTSSSTPAWRFCISTKPGPRTVGQPNPEANTALGRSEEHTSELQSRLHLVCRLLLEKKKKTRSYTTSVRLTSQISLQRHGNSCSDG